jgi:hypothetical protein
MEAPVTSAAKAASELSPKAHMISRFPLCLETLTANSPFVGSFLISRTSSLWADSALAMLSFSDELGSTATKTSGSGKRAMKSFQEAFITATK